MICHTHTHATLLNVTGRYSELLSYKDWMRVNCAQRVHMNYVENIANYFALMGVCSLKFPRVAAISGAVVIAGRIIYGESSASLCQWRLTAVVFPCHVVILCMLAWACTGIGYRGKDGAKGRLAGGIIFHIGELGLLIGSVRSALSLLL